jgi:protein-S-isoprenylcysteine O-methyltransferase Ste14
LNWKNGSARKIKKNIPEMVLSFCRKGMANQHRRDEWLREMESRQHNVVFPNTVENEARFWRNVDKQPYRTSTKIGLAILAIFVFGFLIRILVATHKEGVFWRFVLGMLLFCGPTFAVIAWATRRNLRNIEDSKRSRRMRNH